MLDSGTHCSKGSKGSASSKGSVKAGGVEGAWLVDFALRGFSSVSSSSERARSSRLLRAASDAASVGGDAASLSGDVPLLRADDASLCVNPAVPGGDADSLDGALFAGVRSSHTARRTSFRLQARPPSGTRSRADETSSLVAPSDPGASDAPPRENPRPKTRRADVDCSAPARSFLRPQPFAPFDAPAPTPRRSLLRS